MKIIHKYILKQILLVSFSSVLFFMFVLVLGNTLRDMAGKLASDQITIGMFFQLTALIIPKVVPYALPLGFLTAILLVMGRLSSQQEITAMRAAGLSLRHITAPLFLLAFAGTLLSAIINIHYAPKAETMYKQQLFNIVRDNPSRFIQPKQFIHHFPGYVLYIESITNQKLENFWLWELDDQKRTTILIRGKEGVFEPDESSNAIILNLKDGIGEKRPDEDPENLQDNTTPYLLFKDLSIKLPLDKIFGEKQFYRKLALHTFDELIAIRAKWQNSDAPNAFREQINVQLTIQKKWAMAFSVFSLVAIAIPLSIKVGRSETSANIVIALILAMLYYASIVVISWLNQQPHLRPDLLIWIPNLLFQCLGLYLAKRLSSL